MFTAPTRVAVLALTLSALAPASSQATLVLTAGVDNTNTANVLFQADDTGNPLNANIDHTGSLAIFSTTQAGGLIADPNGQANVAPDGSTGNRSGTLLTNISVTTDLSGGFEKIVFNLFGDGLSNIGPATLTVSSTGGTTTTTTFDAASNNVDPFIANNGNNFYTLTASAGELIQSITIDVDTSQMGTTGTIDLRQVRIGAGAAITPTPEPSTVVMALAGLIPVALIQIRRRCRAASNPS